MLSWSCHESDAEVDLAAVAAGEGDAGLPLGRELLSFATAAAELRSDDTSMGVARDALVAAAGYEVMVDAAAVAANFHMMTRLADGTGARYPESRQTDMARTIAAMGTAEMTSRR